MRKFLVCVIEFSMFAGLQIGKKVTAEELRGVKLSFKVLESYSDDQTVNMLVRLRAKNTSSAPVNNLIATVSHAENVQVHTGAVYFEDIGGGETALSSESFNISLKSSNSQEPPQNKLIWQVEYVNSDGERVVEKVSL